MAAERPRIGRGLAAAALLLALAACSRPDWTNPETSKGSRTPPPPKAVPARPTDPGGAPAPPAWVAPLLGQPVRVAFPKDGACMGNTDGIEVVFTGDPRGLRLIGWGWEPAAKSPVPRVVLTDTQNRIIGGGEAGQSRPDVPKAVPAITSDHTGWSATAAGVTAGTVKAFGVIENGRAVCMLGGAEL